MIEIKQAWIVKTIDEEQRYVPYDSLGMHAMIMRGLKKGPVTVNGKNVIAEETWAYEILED